MATKASQRVQRYVNANGPTIGTVERRVIEQDGLYFKDIDGTGTVSAVNDWRLAPEERAKAYVQTLTTSEKIGQLFTSDWRMGPSILPPVWQPTATSPWAMTPACWMRHRWTFPTASSAIRRCPAPPTWSKSASTAMSSCARTPPPKIWPTI